MIPRCEESVTLLFGGLSIHFSVTSRLGMPSDAERNESLPASARCRVFLLQIEIIFAESKKQNGFWTLRYGVDPLALPAPLPSPLAHNELLKLKLNREIRPTSAVGPH